MQWLASGQVLTGDHFDHRAGRATDDVQQETGRAFDGADLELWIDAALEAMR